MSEQRVTIRAAGGYLSFQPAFTPDGQPDSTGPVAVQYRPTAGEWEGLFIDGLTPAPTPPPEGGGGGGTDPTPPPTNAHWPGNIPPSESADYVAQIKSWLAQQGVNLQGPCGAFEIVANVAWGLETLNTGCGLLSKPGGNNCMAYSTDVLAYRDYANGGTRIVDILGDAGGQNNPSWQEKGPEENRPMEEWRPPIDPNTVAMSAMRQDITKINDKLDAIYHALVPKAKK